VFQCFSYPALVDFSAATSAAEASEAASLRPWSTATVHVDGSRRPFTSTVPVHGRLAVVSGRWSMVTGRWSLVSGPWSTDFTRKPNETRAPDPESQNKPGSDSPSSAGRFAEELHQEVKGPRGKSATPIGLRASTPAPRRPSQTLADTRRPSLTPLASPVFPASPADPNSLRLTANAAACPPAHLPACLPAACRILKIAAAVCCVLLLRAAACQQWCRCREGCCGNCAARRGAARRGGARRAAELHRAAPPSPRATSSSLRIGESCESPSEPCVLVFGFHDGGSGSGSVKHVYLIHPLQHHSSPFIIVTCNLASLTIQRHAPTERLRGRAVPRRRALDPERLVSGGQSLAPSACCPASVPACLPASGVRARLRACLGPHVRACVPLVSSLRLLRLQ
jgi:hypothetical protein